MIAHNRARAAALVAAIGGGIASVALLISSGRNNAAIPTLVAMFVLWVSFPFVVLGWAIVVSARWVALMRGALYPLTFVVAAASLIVYGWRVLRPPATTGAFVFVVVPPVSCVVIATVLLIAARKARAAGRAHRLVTTHSAIDRSS